jgi:hypothetical protein
MKRAFLYLFCSLFICISASAQEVLYPVRGNTSGLETMHVEVDPNQRDRSRYVAEKTFEYKLAVEYPTKEEAGFLPNSEAHITMFWLRVENTAKRPLQISTSGFSLTDEEGHSFPLLSPEEAFNRIMSSTLGRRTFLSNTKKAMGRSVVTEDELKDETVRFSFQSGTVDGQGLKQGLIFFEVPNRKKFTVTLRLGELWSRPFTFTNVKPKN